MSVSLGVIAAANVGTIPGWLTLVVLLAVAFILIRGGAGQAVEGLQATNRELQRQIHELQRQVETLSKENAELKGRTDVTVAIAPLIEWSVHHEARAQERHDGTLKVLDLIASRFGKENGT